MRATNRARKNLSRKGKLILAKVNRTASHVTKGVDHYVTEKPYRSMGLMMLAGVCIGFLMHRDQ